MARSSAVRSPQTIGVAFLFLGLLIGTPRPAAAQDSAAFIQQLGTQAIQVMGPSVPPDVRAARLRSLFDNDFDLPGVARFVLGAHARQMTPQQLEEFQALFRETLVHAYSEKLAQYGGQQFRVVGSRPAGSETIVSSEVERSGGAPVKIDWTVADSGGHKLVTDVAIDGISQKVTERSQFAAIIQRNGGRPDALLAALRQQLPQTRAPMTGSSSPPPGYAPPGDGTR